MTNLKLICLLFLMFPFSSLAQVNSEYIDEAANDLHTFSNQKNNASIIYLIATGLLAAATQAEDQIDRNTLGAVGLGVAVIAAGIDRMSYKHTKNAADNLYRSTRVSTQSEVTETTESKDSTRTYNVKPDKIRTKNERKSFVNKWSTELDSQMMRLESLCRDSEGTELTECNVIRKEINNAKYYLKSYNNDDLYYWTGVKQDIEGGIKELNILFANSTSDMIKSQIAVALSIFQSMYNESELK